MKVIPTSSEELFSSIVRVLFYGLKIIGLAPLSIQHKTRTGNSRNTSIGVFLFSEMGMLYNLVLVIPIAIISVNGMILRISSDYMRKSSVPLSMNLILDCMFVLTCWFIIIYWAFGQEKAAIIINRLTHVHFLLSAGQKANLSNRKASIVLAAHMAFSAFIWVTGLILSSILLDSVLSALQYRATLFIVYWFFIEYSIILGVLAMEFESLNKSLLNLREFPKRIFLTPSFNEHLGVLDSSTHCQTQLANLELLHSVRTTLFVVSQDISEFFSLPILFSIACFSPAFLYTVYHTIIPALISTSDASVNFYFNCIVWISIIVYPLILLLFNVTETTKKARLTTRSVHKLLAAARTQKMVEKLRQFSYQLIDQDVCFTAYGFFELDFKLLGSIVRATITYLVIIIQLVQPENT